MAVYTEITDEDLEHFLKSYSLGELLSFQGIVEGIENTNYLVHTGSGEYILTLYEKRVKPGDLPFFVQLMQHLAEHGISCPAPIPDTSGRIIKELRGRPAVIISFLDGVWIRRPQAVHCAGMGELMARMHLAAASFGSRRQNGLSLSDCHALLGNISPADANGIFPALHDIITDELGFLECNVPPELPEGIIHADMFPDNVFFIGKQVSGLIDFYFACNDALAYDLGICLNAWCFEPDGDFNITKARAMLRGYEQVRKLLAAEIEALPLLARRAALRFVLTRVYDWINTPKDALVRPKDPMEYVHKLRFHKQVASVSEYGI
jgi:homoserine kinase type II